jgi:branched-chain amino acid transport system permease protein
VTLFWSGLATGSIYALVAVGFNIVMTATGVLNFAQGALVMLGGFLGYWAIVQLGLPIVLSLVISVALGAGAGAMTELVAVRPLKRGTAAEESFALVTTVGFATAIAGGVAILWGTLPVTVKLPGSGSPIAFLGGHVLPLELAVIALAFICGGLAQLFLAHSRMGLACLACSEDRNAALVAGINVRRLSVSAFCAAGALAGLAGFLTGPLTYSIYSLGDTLALSGFVALALGGFGNMFGCLLGGWISGLVVTYASTYVNGDFAEVGLFCLLLVVLLVRPHGLLGARTVRHV